MVLVYDESRDEVKYDPCASVIIHEITLCINTSVYDINDESNAQFLNINFNNYLANFYTSVNNVTSNVLIYVLRNWENVEINSLFYYRLKTDLSDIEYVFRHAADNKNNDDNTSVVYGDVAFEFVFSKGASSWAQTSLVDGPYGEKAHKWFVYNGTTREQINGITVNMTLEFQNTSQSLTYSDVSCSGDNLVITNNELKIVSTITTDNFDTNDEIYDQLYNLINDFNNLNILNLTIFYDNSFENVFDNFNLTFSNGLNLNFELSSDIYTNINFEISMQLISSDTNNDIYKLSVNASILMIFEVLSSEYYDIDRDVN